MPETIDSANAAASTLFLGHNGEWWDFWVIVSVVIAAAAAIAIGVTTTASIVSHKREAAAAELALDVFKKETDGKISDANARAADANARALEAKLELEKFKAPRILNTVQGARIASKLVAFSMTRYDVGIGPKGDPEPLYLAREIVESLSNAGWMQVPWSGDGETYTEQPMQSVGLTMVTNVIIDVYPPHWARLGPAAQALARALNDEGIAAIADSRATAVPTDVIHVRIGRKL